MKPVKSTYSAPPTERLCLAIFSPQKNTLFASVIPGRTGKSLTQLFLVAIFWCSVFPLFQKYTIVPLMQSPWCKTNCTMRKLSKFNLPFCKLLTAFFLNLFICLGPFEIFLYLHLCLHDPQIQNQCHLYTKSMCS